MPSAASTRKCGSSACAPDGLAAARGSTTLRGKLFRRSDGAIVHIELPAIAPVIEFADRTFRAKSEFHVTLLGREILTRAGLIDFPDLDSAIRSAARGAKFLVELRDELWLVTEGEAATIIRMCNVGGAEDFYRRFESLTGARIDRPPHHVTLYTSGTAKGIGIATRRELESRGRTLSSDEAALLRVACSV